MKYFLATYDIYDRVYEHNGAVIFAAETQDAAEKLARSEEYDSETDNVTFYFSYGGDGMQK